MNRLLIVVEDLNKGTGSNVKACFNRTVVAEWNTRASVSTDQTILADGDDDFTNVAIDSSFEDETWLKDNVTFTYSGSNATGEMNLGGLSSGALAQVTVEALV